MLPPQPSQLMHQHTHPNRRQRLSMLIEVRVPPPSHHFFQPEPVKPQTGPAIIMSKCSSKPPKKKSWPRNRKGLRLTEKEEKRLVKDAMLFMKCGHNIDNYAFMVELGNARFLKDEYNLKGILERPLGEKWAFREFFERFPEVRIGIDENRSLAKRDGRGTCISRIRNLIRKYKIDSENIYAMTADLGFLTKKSRMNSKLHLYRLSNPKRQSHHVGSAIFCVSKAGRFLEPSVIWRGDYESTHGFKHEYGLNFATNSQGWANQHDLNHWLKKFFNSQTRPEKDEAGYRPWRLLIISHPFCRLKEKFFILCKKSRIICFSLGMKKSEDLDPFACGITDYIHEMYDEKLQELWIDKEGKDTSGLEPSIFSAIILKLAVGKRSKRERQSAIREAWEGCELFSPSSTSDQDSERASSASSDEGDIIQSKEKSLHGQDEDEDQPSANEDTQGADTDCQRSKVINLPNSEFIPYHRFFSGSPRPVTPPVQITDKGKSSCVEPSKLPQSVDQPSQTVRSKRERFSASADPPTSTWPQAQSGTNGESSQSAVALPSQAAHADSSYQTPRRKRPKLDPSPKKPQEDSPTAFIKILNRTPVPEWSYPDHLPTGPRAQIHPKPRNHDPSSQSSPGRQRQGRSRSRKRGAPVSPPPEGHQSHPGSNRPVTPNPGPRGRDPARRENGQPSTTSRSRGRHQSRPRNVPSDTRRRDSSGPENSSTRNPSTGQGSNIYPQRYRPTTPNSPPRRPMSPDYHHRRHPRGSEGRPGNDYHSPTGSGSQAQQLNEALSMLKQMAAWWRSSRPSQESR